jgi:protein involved in polysaccharide export with SLBB domain
MKIKSYYLILLLTLFYALCLAQISTETQNLIPVSVSVTGDVAKPGIYTLTTLNHVSDALAVADRQMTTLPPAEQAAALATGISLQEYRPAAVRDTTQTVIYGQRSVILSRQGKQQNLDLLKFFRLGDMAQNPFLKDGDIINVSPALHKVSLQGSVNRAGDYEYRKDETLKDLLDLALGVTDDAALKHVIFYRYAENFIDFDKSELDLTGYPESGNAALLKVLQPGDRIMVPANSEYRKAYKVTVTGKVKLPGMYYVSSETTLFELLQMCGGPTQEADLGNSFLYNRLVSQNFDPDFDRLSKYSYTQMTWLEYSYLRTKTRQLKGKYSVDIAKCWNTQGQDANLTLRDGDELYVPETLNGVWVAGQVKNPGLVVWQKDMKWKDYLASAGGFANNRKAQGTRIIRVHSGNWIKPSNQIQINAGDIIFVPDKEETYTWDYVKEVILLASQVLTIIIALKTF